MSAGDWALHEVVFAGATADFLGMQVVCHRDVVVAVAVAGVVERVLLIEGGSGDIPSVHVPLEGLEEGVIAREAGERWSAVAVVVAVFIEVTHVEQHTVCGWMLTEDLKGLLKGIRCHVVVAVEKGGEGCLDVWNALVACIRLSVVLWQGDDLDAGMLLLVAVQHR